jgi:hypothetical protein
MIMGLIGGFPLPFMLFFIGGLGLWWAIYWGISGFFSDGYKSDEDKLDY